MAHSEEKSYVVSTLYGGSGGDYWDDGIYHGVKKITLRFGGCIDSIAVEYYRKGETIKAQKHGGDGGGDPKTITFGADEFLKTVSGYVGMTDWGSHKYFVIRSLKFETNIKKYGPFGEERGDPFTFTVKDGDQISGFIGRGHGAPSRGQIETSEAEVFLVCSRKNMASESSFVQPLIPKFYGHYDHWSLLMETFLRSKEYGSLVESGITAAATEADPTEGSSKVIEEQKLKDLKVKNYLFQAIDRSIMGTILNKDTAKIIWDSFSLKQKYQSTGVYVE